MNKLKRRQWLCVSALLLISIIVSPAFAHPPREVTLALSPSGELTVSVEHSVDNPEKHYINKITVYADNKILVSKDYGSQTSTGVQTDTFSLGSLPSGTTLKVEAFCVIMGSATGATVVP